MVAVLPPLAVDELRLYWCPERDPGESRRTRVDRLLRNVLAPLVNVPAATLHFARESKGRPYLPLPGAPDFNLSDTTGGSLIAVSRQGRVGVDLERIDRQAPVSRLAARWFAAAEADALAHLPVDAARRAFLHLWTAKEASCKATGTGIYGYLSRWCFEVAAEQPRLLQAPPDAGTVEQWRFLRVTPSPDHTAVLALWSVPPARVTRYTLAEP